MHIVAIDAGRGYSTVSRSLDAAVRAAQETGATVLRVSLNSLHITKCTGCKLCALGDGCKIDDDLALLSAQIGAADGVILAYPSSGKSNARSLDAMLKRLSSYFSHDGQLQLPGLVPTTRDENPTVRAARRAVIITAASSSVPIAAYFSRANGQIRHLRETLATSGIRSIGSITVSDHLEGGRLAAEELDKAASLGRVLAGKI